MSLANINRRDISYEHAAGAVSLDAVDDGAPVEVVGAAGGLVAFGDPGEGF